MLGRESETAWLRQTLAPGSCVQVVGPTGMGKSTVARAVAPELPWFSLEPVATGSLLAHLAGRLDCLATPASIRAALAEAGGCVFDGAEAHTTELVQLVDALEGLTLLVTTQVRMGPWPALELGPLPHAQAVELFLTLGRRVAKGLEVSPAIEDLVRHLDGWPLAIELAASRLRLYAPQEMLEEDLLSVLSDRHRSGRHSSLQVALQVSWSLLKPDERTGLARIALLCHPFGRSVFRRVTQSDLDVLEGLMDASLIVWETANGRRRYRLLHAVRAFARQQLPDDDPAHALHRAMVLERAEAARALVHGPRGRQGYDELHLLADDLRALLEGTPDDAARAALALGTLALIQGPLDTANATLERVLERGVSPDLAVACRICLVEVRIGLGQDEAAARMAEALPDGPEVWRLRGRAWLRSDAERAEACFVNARDLADAVGDASVATLSRAALAVAHRRRNDNAAALAAYTESLALARQHRLIGAESAILANRTLIEIDLSGADANTRASLEHAAQLALDEGHLRRHCQVYTLLARIAVEMGAPDADAVIQEARDTAERLGDAFRASMLDSIEAFWRLECGAFDTVERLISSPGGGAMRSAQLIHLRAYLAWGRGEHSTAVALFQDVLGRWVTLDLEREAILTRINLAVLTGGTVEALDPAVWPPGSPLAIAVEMATHLTEGRTIPAALGAAARVSVECRLLREFGEAGDGVTVARDGGWFRVNEGRVDLSRRRVLARVLACLAARAGEPVALETVIDEGWPGERLAGDSGKTRVHVAIADLRRMGLRDALQTVDGAYVLAATVSES